MGEDRHMQCVWVRKVWRIMWGRVDATYDGWTHKGRLIRLRIGTKRVETGCCIALITRRRLWCVWLCRHKAKGVPAHG